MAIYQFMTDDGELIECSFPMRTAPRIGDRIQTLNAVGEDVTATRIVSPCQVQPDRWKPYVSSRLPRNLAGCPCTTDGKPIVATKSQEMDICSKFGYERE